MIFFAHPTHLSSPTLISFQCDGAPIREAIQKLATETGNKLVASPAMDFGTLVVNVHNVSLETLQQKIGNMLAAKWVDEDGVETLTPDSRLTRRQDGDGITTLGSRVANDLQRQASQIPVGQNKASGDANGLRRAFLRVLASIDSHTWGSLEDGQLVVLSNRPTPMQRPIPSSPDADQLCTAPRAANVAFNGASNVLLQPKTTLIFISRESPFDVNPDQYTASISSFDVSGALIWTDEVTFSGSFPAYDGITTAQDDLTRSNKQVQLSPFGKEIAQVSPNGIQFAPGLIPYFTGLKSVEPLSVVGDGLVEESSDSGRQLLAWLPDTVFGEAVQKVIAPPSLDPKAAPGNAVTSSYSLSLLQQFIQNSYQLKSDREGDWDLISPTNSFDAKETYTNRQTLHSEAKFFAEGHQFGLSELMRFCRMNPKDTLTPMVAAAKDYCSRAAMIFATQRQLTFGHFLNSLNQEQLATALGGGLISTSDLGTDAKRWASRMLFEPGAIPFKFSRLKSPPTDEGDNPKYELKRVDSLESIPSVACPNGLPESGFVDFQTSTFQGYQLANIGTQNSLELINGNTGYSLSAMAFEIFRQKEDPNDTGLFKTSVDSLKSIYLGEVTKMYAEFSLNDTEAVQISATDGKFDRTQHYSLETLPPAIADRVNKQVLDLQKQNQ